MKFVFKGRKGLDLYATDEELETLSALISAARSEYNRGVNGVSHEWSPVAIWCDIEAPIEEMTSGLDYDYIIEMARKD